MSELKDLLRDAKANLQNLEDLLRRARSIDQAKDDDSVLSRQEIQKYFEEILRSLEQLPENLKLEEAIQRTHKGEIQNLHIQMEEVCRRVEECVGQLESVCEQNLQALSEIVESVKCPKPTKIGEIPMASKLTSPNELLTQGKIHYENQDYEASLKIMSQALAIDPDNPEAAELMAKAQKRLEDRRLEDELVIHIENLKKEAMEQFDREEYRECLKTFNFLCELEPKNRTLRDYLELSRQRVQEMEDLTPESSDKMESVVQAEAGEEEAVATGDSDGETTRLESETTQVETQIQGSQQGSAPTSDFAMPLNPPALSPSGNVLLDKTLELAEQTTGKENLPASQQSTVKRWVAASLIGAALLLCSVLGWRSTLKPNGQNLSSNLEIQSDPEGAEVRLNGKLKGQTGLRLESLAEGSYDLHIAKEGYTPLTQTLSLEKGQSAWLSAHLNKLNPLPSNSMDLEEIAKSFFGQGNFLEASRNCDAILKKDAQNSFALRLKEKIRKQYLQQSKSAMLKGRWEEAKLALENTLKVSPRDTEASRQLKVVKTKLRKNTETVSSSEAELKIKIGELHRQISVAANSANYLPPNTGNALDLIKQLLGLDPNDSFAKEKLGQIQRELLAQVQRKSQSKDFNGARAILRQVQMHFPEIVDLRNLSETLKAEEAKQVEAYSMWIQRAESAMTANHYVTPINENALVYCNRFLAIEPQNQKAIILKKEIISKAIAQAKECIHAENFDEAREVYSSLLQMSTVESRFPLATSELKGELARITFNAYPVIHDHAFGSCTGRLRFNAYVINFVPSGNSKDGFSGKLAEIALGEAGDKLKVQFKNKTYRFEANSVTSKEENREKLRTIYQQVSELVAKVK